MKNNTSTRRPRILSLIMLLLLLVLAGLQFWPVDRSVPEQIEAPSFGESPQGKEATALLRAACYDCHSYESEYPWYSYVAPLSMWIQGHIRAGRETLNFNEWDSYTADKQEDQLKECIEEIEQGHMPLGSYTKLHPEARLSEEDKKLLISWLKGQIAG